MWKQEAALLQHKPGEPVSCTPSRPQVSHRLPKEAPQISKVTLNEHPLRVISRKKTAQEHISYLLCLGRLDPCQQIIKNEDRAQALRENPVLMGVIVKSSHEHGNPGKSLVVPRL